MIDLEDVLKTHEYVLRRYGGTFGNQYEICQKEFRHFLENAKCELPDIRVPG
jgi:hypothetical protein